MPRTTHLKKLPVVNAAKTYIGIDNGVTGTIAIIGPRITIFKPTPTKKYLSYTKKKQWITRVDTVLLKSMLVLWYTTRPPFCLIERPMVNPGRFKASVSAMRALEATQIVLEELAIPFEFIDSREWQAAMLPKGLRKEELKQASLQVGKRLFPALKIKGKDADGLLIAEYARRKGL